MLGMDAPLDGYGLCPDSRILASKDVETDPGGRRNTIILLISDALEQLCRAIAALRRDDAELGHMPADRVRQHRSLTNQKLPAAMQHQARLLLFRLRRNKSHRRPLDRLAAPGASDKSGANFPAVQDPAVITVTLLRCAVSSARLASSGSQLIASHAAASSASTG